jgi:hypothetical protein
VPVDFFDSCLELAGSVSCVSHMFVLQVCCRLAVHLVQRCDHAIGPLKFILLNLSPRVTLWLNVINNFCLVLLILVKLF